MEANNGYFDNAATTFPKPDCVYEYANSVYRKCGGNVGRGSNPIAKRASSIAKQTKDLLRELFHCEGKQIVFTPSATDALNRILLGLGLSEGDIVYHTPFEHNAVTRPLHHLKTSAGIHIETMSFSTQTFLPNLDEIEKQFASDKPKVVVMTHISNVCGVVVPFADIAKLAKKYDAIVVLDMSQSAGLIDTDLSNAMIDYAVFAGHKTLFGPFGIGGFVCAKDSRLNPVVFGGNGVNSIEQEMPTEISKMIEIGSQNIYAIAGLHASVGWILSKGIEQIHDQESRNRDALVSLLRQYSNIKLIGYGNVANQAGVVSSQFDGYSPDEIEMILGNFGISIRAGLHCAPTAHRFLGTLPKGTVRFSVSALTTEDDMQKLKEALDAVEQDY